jgi:hypothetical protein
VVNSTIDSILFADLDTNLYNVGVVNPFTNTPKVLELLAVLHGSNSSF